MSRWYADAEEYIVDSELRVMAGPFSRSTPAIALIQRAYAQRKAVYSCASRFYLAKHGPYKRTAAGDAALAQAVAFPALAAAAVQLLGPKTPTLGGGYDAADWAVLDALLVEAGLLTAPLPAREKVAPDEDLPF